MRSIGLPGYRGAGLSNQRMALEIAVGIAHLTDRRLELFDLPLLENRGGPDVPLRITDVIDIPIPWTAVDDAAAGGPKIWSSVASPWCSLATPPASRGATWYWPKLSGCVLIAPGAPLNPHALTAFAHGRTQLVPLEQLCQPGSPPQVRIEVNLLSFYSFAFFLPPQSSLHSVLQLVRPAAVYRAMAAELAGRLGEFDAVHLRLGDFTRWVKTPRAGQVRVEEVERNLASVIPLDREILILSDQPDHRLVEGLLRRLPRARVFERWLADLGPQPWLGRPLTGAETGLLGQLIAERSRHFFGTMGSTFTAFIHRARGARTFRFAYNMFPEVFDFADCALIEDRGAGSFSWQRLRRKAHFPIEDFAWFREWPEAVTGEVSPARTTSA